MSKIRNALPLTVPCVLALVCMGTPSGALAAIRYVNAARPDDSGSGLSWASAKKTLQAALAGAVGGDEVWVAAGVYKPDQGGGQSPGDRFATFHLLSSVAIYGGFGGVESSLSQRDIAANPTILSGDLSGNDNPVFCVTDSDCSGVFGDNCLDGTCNISAGNGDNSFHVVTGTSAPSAILDGFTVTAGNANSGGSNNRGGGMFTNGGSVNVVNCLFTRNFAIFGGGGIYDSSNGTRVIDCTFAGNTCGNGGGGGGSGGGGLVTQSSNITIAKCTFRGNVSKGSGGGGGGSGAGGGLHISGGGGSTTVLNCAFFGNQAATGGGMAITGAGGTQKTNLAFSGNSADIGGGLYNGSGSNGPLTNCTFSRNTATSSGGGMYVDGSGPNIRNSILWQNSDAGGMDESAQIHNAGGSPVVNYSLVQGGWTGAGGPGNLNADPLFIDANGQDNIHGTSDDDLGLMSGSAAIDSANSFFLMSDLTDLDGDGDTTEAIPIDVAGNPRQVDDPLRPDTGTGPAPAVDMGAYERQPALAPITLYVYQYAAGANNGSSWFDAFVHLQDALSLAASNSLVTQIWVAQGTYEPDQGVGITPGDRMATFQLLNGVSLYGGFTGVEAILSERDPAARVTFLSGDLSHNDTLIECASNADCNSFGGLCTDSVCVVPDNNDDNSYHVVTGSGTDATAVLDGFTITRANANGPAPEDRGAAMFIDGGSPTVANCDLRQNSASGPGGGTFNFFSSPSFRNCTFRWNFAGTNAGAMYNLGGNPMVGNCVFDRNKAQGSGGAMENDFNSSPTVVNSNFVGNSGNVNGGAMFNVSGGNPTVANCSFSGNSAFVSGGAMFLDGVSPTFTNCTFSRNTAQVGDGGGIYASDAGINPSVVNCVLWGNSDQGGMDSSAQVHAANGASPFVYYSVVQGGWAGDGSNILSSDPQFSDADGPDNRLGTPDDDPRPLAGSPAVDSGDTSEVAPDTADLDGDADTAEPVPFDLVGNPRRFDDPFAPDTGVGPAPIVDRGAYESQGSTVLFVDASVSAAGVAGVNNGGAWASAFSNLQSALSFAAITPSITEIWVADGSYMPDGGRTPIGGTHTSGTGNRTATFQLLNNVTMYGGFAGGETTLDDRNLAANIATLSGDLLGDDQPDFGNYTENSFHVVTGSGTNATAFLDGFTVTGGNANGGTNPTAHGGGYFSEAGNATLRSCRFVDNRTNASGGGVDLRSGSNSDIIDCVFERNQAFQGGGLSGNSSASGRIKGCTFRSNTATNGGGGVALQTGAWIVSRTSLIGNVANAYGGGVALVDLSPTSFVNCSFFENQADFGGGVSSIAFTSTAATFVNSQFAANSATGPVGGGAIHCSENACTNFIFVNSTFHANTAPAGNGGGIRAQQGSGPSVRNCILWGNSDLGGMDSGAQIEPSAATPIVHFSTVQGGWTGSGSNNLSSDPLFFDPDGVDSVVGTIDDNLRLRVGSPAINAGNTLFVVGDPADLDGDGITNEQTPLDLGGQSRFVAMVDQGAYEYFTDCNNNGVPDATDIAEGNSQDCDPGGKFSPNGIPDECDIADCSVPFTCAGGADAGEPCSQHAECDSDHCAGFEDFWCQDCNLNTTPDQCDLSSGFSNDVDSNGIPDECGFFTGNCAVVGQEQFWTCPENWELNGQYPDNEDSAAGISVNLPGGAVVILDEHVAIPSLYIDNGAELQMITPDTGIDVGQFIQVDGILTMESCRLVANTPPMLSIRAGGKFLTTPCTSEGKPSTMTAAEISIIGSDCFIPPCPDGGRVDLIESMSFSSSGDLVIDGSMANGSCEEPLRDADGNRLTYHTPPSYNSRGSSSTSVEGTVYLIGAPHMNIETSIPWELSGSFENQSVRPDCFLWSGGLNMNGTAQEFEVAATDVGAVAPGGQVAGGGQPQFAMGSVKIATDASVTFRDSFDNNLSGQEPCTEAVYIGSLTLEAGASMSIANCRVYYASLAVDPSATISFVGCGELLETQTVLPPQIEPDASGLDKTRFISFSVPAGTGETALRVVLNSLHHVVPTYTGGPSIPFTSFEGQSRWVGPPVQYVESSASGVPFHAAHLQCAPHYQDWSTVGLLHVTGSAITPSSSYGVENVSVACQGSEANCTAVSAPLSIATTRWGDVRAPYNPPDPSVQPDISDVSALVDKFRGAPGAPIKARGLLAGAPGNPFGEITLAVLNVDFGFSHISACVDAFRGVPYPYTIATCP